MSKLELRILRLGGVLIKSGRHKVYDLRGRRITVSHSKKQTNSRDRHKPDMHYMDKIEATMT